ncbi:hypothetical protein [Bdellovibrio bacteriovorus]|uniref:hypothetical protein n=1 Tax=Bdellovibrio bacteriovorus TaxID=959 RepID=UPI0035A63542
MKNDKGFALAIIISLLPLFLGGFLLAFATAGFIAHDLSLKHICREEGLRTQKKVVPLLKKLLSLNPLARRLKEREVRAQKNLAKAQATGLPNVIAAAAAELALAKLRRLELDIKQKQLIQESNRLLRTNHLLTQRKLSSSARGLSSAFLEIQNVRIDGTAPRLAVRPEQMEIAPAYHPQPEFAQAQALAHEWHYQTKVLPPFSHFLSGVFQFRKSCSVTLTEENFQWVAKIIKGRSSLKSVW